MDMSLYKEKAFFPVQPFFATTTTNTIDVSK